MTDDERTLAEQNYLSMYIQGDKEPYHLVAALWNIAWAVEQELKRPWMVIGLPERKKPKRRSIGTWRAMRRF